jgi:hypothetical protein
MACQEAKEAHLEKMEANPEEIKYITEHQEVTKEEAAKEHWRTDKKTGI